MLLERLLDTRDGIGYAGSKPAPRRDGATPGHGRGMTKAASNALAVVLNVTAPEPGSTDISRCGRVGSRSRSHRT